MKIVPKPHQIKIKQGSFIFSAATAVDCPLTVVQAELFFLDFDKNKENRIVFSKSAITEDYIIEIDDDIVVKASSEEGMFHAAMTLKQLIFEGYDNGVSQIPKCCIIDHPRFVHRGFMLDVCRHFFPVSTVKKMISAIALVKMNRFHFHLSEDQGFRLQIDAFPKLHEVGSMRAQTRGDGTPHGGYYTKAQIKEIVDFAAERFIEVIPEIDLPGHTSAMVASYPELSCKGEQIKVKEHFGIHADVVCASKESTYEFLFKVLDEVAEMFPSKYIHIGGDEAPKLKWQDCPDCRKLKDEQGYDDFEKLQGYFTNRIINHLKTLGKTAIVWNEALNSGLLDKSAIIQYWADGAKAKNVVKAIKEDGRKVVVSRVVPYYFDYPCGQSSLKKAYNYEPVMESLSDKDKGAIQGVECPVWTEHIATEEKVFTMAFPRTFAVAETGWSDGAKDYKDFEDRLYNVLGILQVDDIAYIPVDECNPNPIKGAGQMIKFFKFALDKEILRESARNAKSANTKAR